MINANELRIGNLVYDDEGLVCIVNGFTPFDHSVRCDEKEGCIILIDIYQKDGSILKGFECESNFLEPIPLTDEWLLKLGFEKTYESDFRTKYDYTIDTRLGYDIYKSVGNSEDEGMRFRGNHYKHIKYVHQLQNLYFSLTNQELKHK